MANRAAFARADVDDSKRGFPVWAARDHAAQRGLEFLDHATATGFRVALPCDEERQFNVMRGVLAGGAYGVLAHEALEIGYSGDDFDWDGGFYSVRVFAKGGMTKTQAVLSLVPVLGHFVGGGEPTARVKLPCTVAGVRVPELAGARLRLDPRRSAPPYVSANRVKLDGSGWSLFSEAPLDAATVTGGAVGEALAAHGGDGLFQVIVESGTLLVRRNGFLDPDGLEALAATASAIAADWRRLGLAQADPKPFAAELPAPAAALPGRWGAWTADLVARHGLTAEDPGAYHRAFPSVPVPGQAFVVLRGDVPQVGEGRLVVHKEGDSARPAVLVAAPAGREPTPPGGVAHPGVRVECADDVLAAWSTTSYWGDAMAGDLDAFCAAAGAALSLR